MNAFKSFQNQNPNIHLPSYIMRGIEFGVRDKNGTPFENIKSSFLLSKIVTEADLLTGTIQSPNKHPLSYLISIDANARNRIFLDGEAACIISFQRREEGNFAVIRLFEENRTNKETRK